MRRNSKRWVYLIGSMPVQTVKIGVSNEPEARLADLQVGSPVQLHLLWKTHGGQGLESALHAYFAPYRTHGEWFDFGDESPVALVATAAVLLGYRSQPERVEGRPRYIRSDCTSCAGDRVLYVVSGTRVSPAYVWKHPAKPVQPPPAIPAQAQDSAPVTNRDRVLGAVRDGARTGREISDATGINKGTVSREVKALIAASVLRRGTDGTLRLAEADAGLTDNQQAVLKAVRDGATLNTKISKATGLNPGSVARAVDALVKRDLLAKTGIEIREAST